MVPLPTVKYTFFIFFLTKFGALGQASPPWKVIPKGKFLAALDGLSLFVAIWFPRGTYTDVSISGTPIFGTQGLIASSAEPLVLLLQS
ncbi:hypothetical protein BDV35DRAFT_333888 [Aspergillus flavus]|uniref:Uncharacterized protein n=1 Tax=Aspergillus flavus TaxID=5059 RepID=A0A5N6HGJ7_ASPFL|nr:hypothetical protein BDV35DRAFT_333888 [Aspergillus flavus]